MPLFKTTQPTILITSLISSHHFPPFNSSFPTQASSIMSNDQQIQPGIVSNPDGTYTRSIQFPSTPATPDHNTPSPVLSKDIPLNPKNQTWLRIYLPKHALNESSTPNLMLNLPLIVYFHGGGFVFMSAASTTIHDFCVKLASELSAIIISVEYRLAPENRLPAAYDDAIDTLQWLKTTQERWLTQFCDFSCCFVMGTSAGANIAYHAGLLATQVTGDLSPQWACLAPLKIKGLILHHPFFGGLQRVGSELGLIKDPFLTLSGTDLMWELSLPVGVDRDHEYCNPTVGGGSSQLEQVRLAGWRVLVSGCYDDPLINRQMEFANMLKEKGLRTVAYFAEGHHSIELFVESKLKELFVILKIFIYSS
ncbi:Carboxylesterase 1 [Camellia lanceoleosa]|uniref:Carboxylesterase 1 n=1 Tax=Camellia lanceoleosa TaxID=1840588 RepID=A0ACC0H6T1_9ERIC|nr:Carboxylesterase 1 [Camellia lanceoleosa]